jgi:polyisoprenoid-binding protein YceI
MKLRTLATLTALTAFAVSTQAAATTYIIDNSHTYPHFTYSHLGYSIQTHKFDKISGKVVMDFDAKTGSVDVSIDATSVNTGYALFNEHLQGEDYFDTAKYPTITFKSSNMAFKGNKPVSLTGDLTVKGVTKPVKLEVTHFKCMPHPMLKAPACGGNATTKIKRSDFNMGKGVPFVGDEVTLTLAIEAVMEQPAQ